MAAIDEDVRPVIHHVFALILSFYSIDYSMAFNNVIEYFYPSSKELFPPADGTTTLHADGSTHKVDC